MGIAIMVAYVISGSWRVALAIGLLEPCVQTVAYFFHERAWHKFEDKIDEKDHHNSVVDSCSPLTTLVEKILRKK
jgi:uncharacterized membrane protein